MKLFSIRRRGNDGALAEGDGTPPAPRIEVAARTHEGRVRLLNEDRLLILPEIGLWAIADGMGGHQAGDVAAQTVIDSIAAARPSDAGGLQAAVDQAGRVLSDKEARIGISGSTLVTLLIDGRGYRCLWAGDSELWLLRDGAVAKLTRDHSVVEELVRAGVLAEEDRRNHPQANVITRAIGTNGGAELEEVTGELRGGDIFLLCSDGLTGAVDPARLDALGANRPLDAIADGLLAEALNNGALDNVSFIILKVTDPA